MEMFRIENFSFTYPLGKTKALDNVNLTISSGEFVLVCGRTGCGKSTLLRQLKKEITPHGQKTGSITYKGTPIHELDTRTSASQIGFVSQNPDNQIVCDKVWHELAFGLENLGFPTNVIRRRVAEISSFLGIQQWFRKSVHELSGGQKQMLNLAAVMVMHPEVLILDEPTSQLDPIAATEFIETLKKINQDLGMTIILSEHRLEDVFPVADRVLIMDQGRIVCDTPPRKTLEALSSAGIKYHAIEKGLPSAMRIFKGAGGSGVCPVTPKEGREWINTVAGEAARACDFKREKYRPSKKPAVYATEVWFRYGQEMPDVLRGFKIEAYPGEILCILGGNGTGKSTALGVLAGNYKPYRGRVEVFGKKLKSYKGSELYSGLVALLPQLQQALFVCDTVKKDLYDAATCDDIEQRMREVVELMKIEEILDAHPYDLSCGEQQKAAFAKLLIKEPKILLLDEPTKGLDAEYRALFAGILRRLADDGACIIIATHDIEFSAEFADRCALFFDGGVISEDESVAFFAGNSYYTTSANRIARHICPTAITCRDVIELCKTTAKTKTNA